MKIKKKNIIGAILGVLLYLLIVYLFEYFTK